MGLFSKLKDAFFEEVEVEIKEPVVKKKEKQEEPVARKIDVSISKDETDNIDIISERDLLADTKQNSFPIMFEDEDFETEDDFDKTGYDMPKFERHNYNHSNNYDSYQHNYKEDVVVQKKSFKPSPNISPVYGIIEDKDAKKEDFSIKKEVRITIPSNKLDIDSIREKAYGDLTSEFDLKKLSAENNQDLNTDFDLEKSIIEEQESSPIVYDMNEEDENPIVEQVTIGDASEYFEDLGLQYNVDYKDRSQEEAIGRILTKEKKKIEKDLSETTEKKSEDSTYEIFAEEVVKTEQEDNDTKEDLLEDNLFDLIDSMYEDKE